MTTANRCWIYSPFPQTAMTDIFILCDTFIVYGIIVSSWRPEGCKLKLQLLGAVHGSELSIFLPHCWILHTYVLKIVPLETLRVSSSKNKTNSNDILCFLVFVKAMTNKITLMPLYNSRQSGSVIQHNKKTALWNIPNTSQHDQKLRQPEYFCAHKLAFSKSIPLS